MEKLNKILLITVLLTGIFAIYRLIKISKKIDKLSDEVDYTLGFVNVNDSYFEGYDEGYDDGLKKASSDKNKNELKGDE